MQCDQLVTIDNCCNPSQCANPAAWQHTASGLAMCAAHHGNAVKFGFDGEWNVAGKQVPFPEGWVAVEADAGATSASMLAPVEEVRPSGLVVERQLDDSKLRIETGALSPSGLIIER